MQDLTPVTSFFRNRKRSNLRGLRNFLHLVEVNMFEKITLKQMIAKALHNEVIESLQSQAEMF